MKEPREPFMPGEGSDADYDSDTAEYHTRGFRTRRGQAAGPESRGYWISADEVRPPAASAYPARVRPVGRSSSGRSRRRVLLVMVFSLLVFVSLAIVAALTVTGELVVPGISERLFAISYQDEIARAADDYGQDPYLVAAMVKTESGYDADAASEYAVGLMQLRPETAEWIVQDLSTWQGSSDPELTDPGDSLELGTCYLAYLGGIYGEGSMAALAAYNGGPGNVDKWIAAAGGQEFFDLSDIPFPETRQYVQRVERYRALYVQIYPDIFSQTSQ